MQNGANEYPLQCANDLDLFIHPRLPPLVRAHLPIEILEPPPEEPKESQVANEQPFTAAINADMDGGNMISRIEEIRGLPEPTREAIHVDQRPHGPSVPELPGQTQSAPSSAVKPPEHLPIQPAASMSTASSALPSGGAMCTTAAEITIEKASRARWREYDYGEDEEAQDLPTINMDSDSD